MLRALPLPRAVNFHVAESRRRFYFLRHGHLLRKDWYEYVQHQAATCNAQFLARQVARNWCAYHSALSASVRFLKSCLSSLLPRFLDKVPGTLSLLTLPIDIASVVFFFPTSINHNSVKITHLQAKILANLLYFSDDKLRIKKFRTIFLARFGRLQ